MMFSYNSIYEKLVTNVTSSLIFFSTGATTHCGFVFCSLLPGYSLLAYEVS